MLTISHVSKTFAPGTANEHLALDDISLHLAPGEFVTVIGSNGAGKSTLMNAVSGSFIVDKGRITLGGQDITFVKEHKRARIVGRLFQDPMKGTAPHMTLEENLALAYSRGKRRRFRRAVNAKDTAVFHEGTRSGRPPLHQGRPALRRPAAGRYAFDVYHRAAPRAAIG